MSQIAPKAASVASFDKGLEERKRQISIAKDLVVRTQELFEEFGSAELKTTHARFPELINALNANEVRLVVLGEFSRGKSYLLNSLLGIEVLPTATQTTTAINTFLKPLPKGETERYIMVHWQDKKKPPERVDWVEDDALERWGTELEETHADLRKEVDHIEVFLDHPLLEKGLVLVDTPGLQTLLKHHEGITRKAIAEAHVALFVQATDQLGGNQTEWEFMENTLKSNFQKFITVINKWDLVLKPQDAKAKKRSEAENIALSLQAVKDNFARVLKDSPNRDNELATLTDENHLMGVSAAWAQSEDLDEVERSGIDRLAKRIIAMVSSGEAMQQIVLKPLQQLSYVQEQLLEGIQAQLDELNSTDSLEVRRRELELKEAKIKQLDSDAKSEAKESHADHERLANATAEKVRHELIAPLKQLKREVQDEITVSYIEKLLYKSLHEQQEEGTPKIGLPPELDLHIKQVQTQVVKSWSQQKNKMLSTLSDLRAGYLEKMQKHAQQFDAQLGNKTIDMPDITVNLDFDFSEIQEHQRVTARLQAAAEEAERRKNEIEEKLQRGLISEVRALEERRNAELEANRARRQIHNLGPCPAPKIYTERVLVEREGFLGWIKDRFSKQYQEHEHVDEEAVEAWRKSRNALNKELETKKEIEERLQKEYEAKTGQRMKAEQASKMAQKELDRLQKQREQAEQKQKELERGMLSEIYKRLHHQTIQQLDHAIDALDSFAQNSVRTIFMEQASLLENAIKEKLLEPLNAEMAQKKEIQRLIAEGEKALEEKHNSLDHGLQEVASLHRVTEARLRQFKNKASVFLNEPANQ